MRTGMPSFSLENFYPVSRHGFLEEMHATISRSPIRASEDGSILGLLCCVEEVTERLINTRRLQTLRDLSVHTVQAADVQDACLRGADVLTRNPYDVPCALLYLPAPSEGLRVQAAVRVPHAALQLLECNTAFLDSLTQVFATRQHKRLSFSVAVQSLLPEVMHGTVSLGAPREALLLSLAPSSEEANKGAWGGVLVLGLNPGRPLDEAHTNYCKLVTSQLSCELILAREQALQRRWAEEQEALRQEAERTNAAKDRFLAVLSHELRTPITPALLVAEGMAADDALAPAVRADAEFIAQSMRLEAKLINDLLDVTRIREHKIVLDKQPLHLHELLTHTSKLVQSAAVSKRLALELRLCAERDVVTGDWVRLQQVFWVRVVLSCVVK